MDACLFVIALFWAILGFDIILGVDWLQRYGVVVDCEGFLVTARADDGQRVVFGGLPSDGVMASFLNSLDIPHGVVRCAHGWPVSGHLRGSDRTSTTPRD